MGLSSPDSGDFSFSEEVEPLEASVTSSEDADQLDLEDGRGILSQVLQLSPILEVDGLPEASASPGSGSLVLSPTAAILLCQTSIDARGADLVCLTSSSHLGMAVSGPIGGAAEPDVASVVKSGEVDRDEDDVALADIDGDVVVLGPATGGNRSVAEDVRCPRAPIFSLAALHEESRGIEGDALSRGIPAISAAGGCDVVSSLSSSHPVAAVSGDFEALDVVALLADRGSPAVDDSGEFLVVDGGVADSDGAQVVDNGLAGFVMPPT
ncbi:hypothetical protein Dimus_022471 [Dionaea muscipula]